MHVCILVHAYELVYTRLVHAHTYAHLIEFLAMVSLVLPTSSDNVVLSYNTAFLHCYHRMGQVDIDIVEVQIKQSLTEMKLSHCEALYHSLLRQQHEFQVWLDPPF